METTVQDTSLEAFRSLSAFLGVKQLEVFRCIRKHPDGISNADISRELGIEINRVTPRVLELRQKGIVVNAGTQKDKITNTWVMLWKAR